MKRIKTISRKTSETSIELELNLDGSGVADIVTPVPFLNHVLESFARHGSFDLIFKAAGDINVDPHHLVEDTGICLGKAIAGCLDDKAGINRFGFAIIPMDEALVTVSLDLGGRSFLNYRVDVVMEKIGNMPTLLIEDFFRSLSDNAAMNLHIIKNSGLNSHHIIEAVFKAFGIALKNAASYSGKDSIPSTKGVI